MRQFHDARQAARTVPPPGPWGWTRPTPGHTAQPGVPTPSSSGRCSNLTVPPGTSRLPGGRGRDHLGSLIPAWEQPVGWACPLSHIPGVNGVPLWAFPPTPMGRSGGQEGELKLNPAPGWLILGLSWWGAVGDKEDTAGGGGLSNSGGSLGDPVAPSSAAQAQDKPTSLGSTPPHSGTPGLSSPSCHGSGVPLAQALAPVGGGQGTCLPGPGLHRASCWRTPHGHRGPGLTSQAGPLHPPPPCALASPFVAAPSSQTRKPRRSREVWWARARESGAGGSPGRDSGPHRELSTVWPWIPLPCQELASPFRVSLVAQTGKNLPAMQEPQV